MRLDEIVDFVALKAKEIDARLPQARAGRSPEVPGGAVGGAVRFWRARVKRGVRLHYLEQGPHQGPAVIMLHGYTDSWFSFSRILPLLPADLRVIVPDQRGHGRSDRPARGYRIDDLAIDVLSLMDALAVPAAVIVGHSMGSFVARRAAQLAPDDVRGLVLEGSAPVPRNAALISLQRDVEALTDPVDQDFVRAFQESCIARPVPEDFMRRVITESRLVPASIWKAAIKGLLAFVPGPQPIRCPVMILGGQKDGVFAEHEQRALAHQLTGGAIHVAPDVGHTPHWEIPEDFAGRLAVFAGAHLTSEK